MKAKITTESQEEPGGLMRKFMISSIALALFASVTSVVLWRDLRAERKLSAGLQQRLSEFNATRPTPLPPSVRPVSGGSTESSGAAAIPVATTASPSTYNLPNQRDLLKDSEYRKARLAQIRLQMPEIYPGLAEALELSPEQAGRLLDMLAENQLEMSAAAQVGPGPDGQIDASQQLEYQRAQQETKTRQDDALASMLGGAWESKWNEYQQTQPARQRVTQLSRSMDAAGLSLNSAQKKPLTDLFAAEQTRRSQEQQAALRDMRANGQPRDAEATARLREESVRIQAESNRRLIDAAAAQLNSRQLDLLRESLEGQLAMNRSNSRMQSAMEVNRASTAPPMPR